MSTVAVIDVGTNSCHLLLGRKTKRGWRTIQRVRERIQLGAGFDATHCLDHAAEERLTHCLVQFSRLIQQVRATAVMAVGTSALRDAKNSAAILSRVKKKTGIAVEVISGEREAELIYHGVARSFPKKARPRLVIDIGGGSTEVVIGCGRVIESAVSLDMGCLRFRDRFFIDDKITQERFSACEHAATALLQTAQQALGTDRWSRAWGASGTIQAVTQVLKSKSKASSGVSVEHLYQLRERLCSFGHSDAIELEGLKVERRSIFPSGLAILIALFEVFSIKRLYPSQGALREGAFIALAEAYTPEGHACAVIENG